MKKRWFGLAALACAACCAAPLLLLSGGVGALALTSVYRISVDQWVCGALLAAMIVTGILWMRRRADKSCATTGNSCATGCGCKPSETPSET